jgi:hypothetical protein
MLLVYAQGELTVTTALQSSVVIVLPVDPVTCVDVTGASMPPYNLRAAWLGVLGMDSSSAISLLLPHVSALLSVPVERLIITNDTRLLAAPLRILPDVRTVVAVVAGTGSIGARAQPMRSRRPSHARAVGAGSSETKAVNLTLGTWQCVLCSVVQSAVTAMSLAQMALETRKNNS